MLFRTSPANRHRATAVGIVMHSSFQAALAAVVLVACVAARGSVGTSCAEGRSAAPGCDHVQWARQFKDHAAAVRAAAAALSYKRPKRAKYYSSGRSGRALYRPAPAPWAPPLYSHTPPPDYALDDEEPTGPPSSSAFKLGLVNRRPPSGPETLVDGDIANLVRSLSKHDLDRIIEYAGEKSGQPHVRNAVEGPARPRPRPRHPVAPGADAAYGGAESGLAPVVDRGPSSFVTDRYTDEEFPQPSGFRDDSVDFDISYTKNVESIIKPMADYKLENFGELPLMNDESKKKSRDSYNVPHYTVTSIAAPPESTRAGSDSQKVGAEPKFELAPSGAGAGAGAAAAARAHSDAHLKAVKIWTHHSVGAAYTVHADGTLSPEKPPPRSPGPATAPRL